MVLELCNSRDDLDIVLLNPYLGTRVSNAEQSKRMVNRTAERLKKLEGIIKRLKGDIGKTGIA